MIDHGETPRPYLSTEQLTQLTPWSVDAIEKMISRGLLVRGVHFFKLGGRRGRLIFKWDAIVGLIEGQAARTHARDVLKPHDHSKSSPKLVMNVETATTELQRLLR